jgi:hypothetical protein
VLDPGVVLRTDGGAARAGLSMITRGAETVARRALTFARPAASLWPVLVNGAAGVVATQDGRPVSVLAFTVAGGRIVEIDSVVDPERLSQLGL